MTNATSSASLPVALTSFIGREREVTAACHLLRQPHVRLLTLTGPGGSGKTRLALEVAATLRDSPANRAAPSESRTQHDFADGVYFVALDAIRDASLVLPALAQVLNVHENWTGDILEPLNVYLREQNMLLLLDNFEHVLPAAPALAKLLGACPSLKLLVTSRAVLRVRGEYEFAVPPLALPDPQRMQDVAALAACEAVALFTARAQASRPDFALTPQNADAVAALCVRLDGLPLAIELAATRTKLFSSQAMLARFGQSLALLTGGMADMPPRQQTLRATIAWSYDLLDAHTQPLCRRLASFHGGCTIGAAEAVCTDTEALDGLAALVDQSLVRRLDGADGEPRFTMLETIREFCAEQLASKGETEAVQRRHAEYYRALAVQAEPHLTGPQQELWLTRLEDEHGNVRAALRRLLDEAEWAGAAQLAGSVWRFWLLRGYIAEGSRWLEECLAHEQPAAADAVWAKALYGWGILLNYQGEYPRAEQALQTALTIYRRLGDRRGCAIALVGLSQAVAVPGDYASAETLCRESIALMREAGDAWGLANALWYIGNTYWMEGDHGAAKAAFEESLQLYTEIGNTSGAAYDQMNLGFVAIEAGDYRTAEQLLHSSLELASARRDKRGMTRSLWGVGESAFRQAQYAEALEAYKQCLTLLAELGDRFFIANLLESVAAVATLQQQPTAAAQLFGAAEALRDSIQAPMMPRSREAYQRNVAGVRAPLGAEAFEAAWAAGRGLSTEQAIGVALNVAPASPTPQPVAPATAAAADTSPARFGLTAREAEVLRLLARGLTDQQIAHELTISPRTVHTHINAIYGKLAVSSRSTATRFALEHRLA